MLTTSDWRARFDRLSDAGAYAERIGRHTQIADHLDDPDYGWYVHHGDLVVPEDLDHDVALIVDGDLVVHGFVDDYVSRIGLLVVLGDLVVRDLVSWGSVYVGGDLRAEGMVCGHYNDFVFEVAGAVHGRALVLSDKSSSYGTGELEAEIDSYDPTREQLRAAREILVPQLYDGGAKRAREGRPPKLGRPSYRRICRRLHAGKPLFRTAD
ncbi:hypothetical protein [Streptomyces sp. BE303]|uniref:hypothetical protein n=1 Tax=Streptomyces sp. BE303 TaxID=3002528 RepID=UPI002E7A3BE1|nr:hypothetical protein [Streptomyces sp. BE303]MED7953063.1 hypothetical protein [Streptomyces sp. BE303]